MSLGPKSNPCWDLVFFVENKGKKATQWDCFYCGCKDGKVEAGGVWYCPNGLCPGPGGAWFRMKLKSFMSHADGSHSIDPIELIKAWALYTKKEQYETEYGGGNERGY